MNQIDVDPEVQRAIERHRRVPSESENDILRRVLAIAAWAPRRPVLETPGPTGTRRRGQWAVELLGETIPAANLKAAWRTLLDALDVRFPEFLSDFAEEEGRTRRFVARSPGELYAAAPHLARRHAEPLAGGWYYDSNVSAAQVARRARIAARLCGLRYGRDLRILESLREI